MATPRGMTPSEYRLWLEMQRRVSAMTPSMNKAILDAFRALSQAMTEAEMLRALQNPDTFADVLVSRANVNRAFAGVRQEIHKDVRDSALWWIRKLPGGGEVGGAVAVGFNILDQRVIEAIRILDSRVMQTLADDVRASVRLFVASGIQEGQASTTIARAARDVIGLAPNQLQAVVNYRQALMSGDFTKALGYGLRDKRSDSVLRRLRKDGGSLTQKQINRMTDTYRRKFIAWNANTVAKTAVNDAQRLGKHLATQAAIDAGILDGAKMYSRWVNSGDDRVREEHQDTPIGAGNTVVKFGEPFETGEIIPGSSTFGCRCIKVDFERRSIA